MKRSVLSLLFMFVALVSTAQTESSHLTFKGVPIDGTMSQFVQKMKQKGFTLLGTQDGTSILKGDFAGSKGCLVGVSTLTQKDLVSQIAVIFPECETWSALSGDYFSLKSLLTEKYGKPSDVIERFDSYSEPRDDKSRMYEVEFDRCKYIRTFETENGTIELSIDHDGVTKCFVLLRYRDKINGDSVRAQALDDL